MGTSTGRRTDAEHVAIALIAVGSAAFLWFITGPRGLGLSSDSMAYLSIARSLGEGDGLRRWGEDPVTTWPALYPTLLWVIAAVTRLDVLDAGRVLSAAMSVVLTLGTWGLLRRTVTDGRVRVAAVVVVVFGTETITVANKLLTDQAFAAGTVVFLLVLVIAARTGSLRWVVGAAALASALFLTRYVGVLLVPLGAVVLALLPRGRSRRARLRSAFVLVVAGAIAPTAQLLWNRSVSGSAFQQRAASATGDNTSFAALPEALSGWFIGQGRPGAVAGAIGVAGGLVVLAAATALVVAGRRTPARPAAEDRRAGDVVAARTVLGTATLLLAAATIGLRAVVAFDLDSRTILVLLAPAMVVLAAAVDAFTPRRGEAAPWWRSRTAVVVVFATWAVALGLFGIRAGLLGRPLGSGFADVRWDPTLDELRRTDVESLLPDGCDRRSNQPSVLLMAGVERVSPTTGVDPGAFGDRVCLVWITGDGEAGSEAELDAIRARLALDEVEAADTYAVLLSRS